MRKIHVIKIRRHNWALRLLWRRRPSLHHLRHLSPNTWKLCESVFQCERLCVKVYGLAGYSTHGVSSVKLKSPTIYTHNIYVHTYVLWVHTYILWVIVTHNIYAPTIHTRISMHPQYIPTIYTMYSTTYTHPQGHYLPGRVVPVGWTSWTYFISNILSTYIQQQLNPCTERVWQTGK